MKHKHFTFLLALLMSMATSAALALGTDGDIEIDGLPSQKHSAKHLATGSEGDIVVNGLYYKINGTEAMVTGTQLLGYMINLNAYENQPDGVQWIEEYEVAYIDDDEDIYGQGLLYYYLPWSFFVNYERVTIEDESWNEYFNEEGYLISDMIWQVSSTEIEVPNFGYDEEGKPIKAIDEEGYPLFCEIDKSNHWNWNNIVRCTFENNNWGEPCLKVYVNWDDVKNSIYPIYSTIPNSAANYWEADNDITDWLPSQITYNGVTYTVTGIAPDALGGGTNYTLDIPESIKYIGSDALLGCYVNDFDPWSSTYIGKVAYHSDGSGVIKEGTIGIASHYNWYETNETSITIPASVVIIGSHAFDNDNLTSVTVAWETPINPKYWGDSDDYNPFPYASNATLYVPKGTKAAYEAAPYWKDFKEIVEIREEIDLADGNGFTNNEEKEMDEVRYTRNYTNTEWQALYVPYALNYEDWQADFDIARLNNANQYDDDEDGTVDRTVLESFYVKSGKTMANTPYLIRAKEAGEKTIVTENATLCKAEERSIDCSSVGTLFTFTGTYSGIPGTEMFTNGYYAMGGGSLHQAESSANALSPYRWYMKVTDRDGNPKNLGEVKIQVIGEDGTDGLTPTLFQEEETAVYDLAGRRTETPTKKGMYIKNGRKVIVR